MTDDSRQLKRDAQKLSYDRTIESINRVCDVYGRGPDMLASVASASINASFLMLYCAARLRHGHIKPEKLFTILGEVISKEFDMFEKGFDIAQEYNSMSPEEREKYDS